MDKTYAVKVEVGLKIEVDNQTMNNKVGNSYIKNNFKLNIMQINNNRWGIYFDTNIN